MRERQETRTIKCCKDRVTSKLVTHSIYTYAVMFTAYTLYAEQYRAEGDWSGNADYIFYIRNGTISILRCIVIPLNNSTQMHRT